jgi:uncharacterized protein (TIRG00374 family)
MQDNQQNNQTSSQKKIWFNIIIVVAILAILLSVVSQLGEFEKVIEVIQTIHGGYFVLALGITLVSLSLMALSHQIVLRALDKELPYGTGFLIQMTEPFFNGITPFSSGAQPLQLYYYHKHGLHGNKATSVLVANMILFQIASIILSVIGISIMWDQMYQAPGNVLFYVMVGCIINVFVLVLFFLLAYVKKAYRLFEKFFGFFERFKLTKKTASKLKAKTGNFVTKFQSGVQFLFTKKRVFLLATTTKIVSLMLYFGTTIMIAKALGFNISGYTPMYLFIASMLAIVCMQFVPLPGASGGTELVFTTLLIGLIMVTQEELLALMLLWRFATYYFGMLYGLVSYLFLMKRKVRNKT